MKLAQALSEYADARHQLEQLHHQILGAARHQEGEEPPEPAVSLLAQYEAVLARRTRLITRINLTNAVTYVEAEPGGRLTLTEALAARDQLRSLAKIQSEVAERAAGTDRHSYSYRAMRSEIRDVTGAGISVTDLRRDANGTSARIRHLDYLIQAAGMTTDLRED